MTLLPRVFAFALAPVGRLQRIVGESSGFIRLRISVLLKVSSLFSAANRFELGSCA
jgi:hypothetical protein